VNPIGAFLWSWAILVDVHRAIYRHRVDAVTGAHQEMALVDGTIRHRHPDREELMHSRLDALHSILDALIDHAERQCVRQRPVNLAYNHLQWFSGRWYRQTCWSVASLDIIRMIWRKGGKASNDT